MSQSNAMDHLADDLEIESQHDRRYYGEQDVQMPASVARSERQQRIAAIQSHLTPSSVRQSAAAARLYRHHRNLSESSIDSQGGAFIDHRRQQHSMGHSVTPQSRLTVAHADRSGGGGPSPSGLGGSRSPDGYLNTGRRGSAGGPYHEQVDDFSLGPSGYRRADHSHGSSRADEDLNQSGISGRTARGFSSQDLDEHPFSDGEDRHSPRQHLQRHHSQKSYQSIPTQAHDHGHEDDHAIDTASRPGSYHGAPEDDICFPAHGADPDADLMDMGYGADRHRHHDHHDAGVPGLLHGYPYPFDFSALEEFAHQEKQGMPIPGARKRRGGPPGAAGGDRLGGGLSPPGYGTSTATARGMAFSSSSNEGEGRRTARQRKLSESVAPGRYRRKLALFEGAGDEEPSGPSPLRGNGANSGSGAHFTTILDTKTPLLDKAGGPAREYGSNAPGVGGTSGAGVGGTTGSARPYRFSFYSNALPSTIHARSLAEIPGEDQSFEELFMGRAADSPYDADAASQHQTQTSHAHRSSSGTHEAKPQAFSPPSGSNTGANTPIGASSTAAAGSINSRPAAVPMADVRARVDKARQGLIRSDVDAEANTWWLDVLCPTDQEMKILSRVSPPALMTQETYSDD